VRGSSLPDRRTRPISKDHYERTVAGGVCLECGAELVFRKNPNGGSYYACMLGYQCFYIGLEYESVAPMEQVG